MKTLIFDIMLNGISCVHWHTSIARCFRLTLMT